mmetsp:Transcript_10475/g.35546  ORF Transcript_10475/g.35546 Transcript_10475/m.35546 type:complete len:323 (+) Transcript_10475:146-1114(+)
MPRRRCSASAACARRNGNVRVERARRRPWIHDGSSRGTATAARRARRALAAPARPLPRVHALREQRLPHPGSVPRGACGPAGLHDLGHRGGGCRGGGPDRRPPPGAGGGGGRPRGGQRRHAPRPGRRTGHALLGGPPHVRRGRALPLHLPIRPGPAAHECARVRGGRGPQRGAAGEGHGEAPTGQGLRLRQLAPARAAVPPRGARGPPADGPARRLRGPRAGGWASGDRVWHAWSWCRPAPSGWAGQITHHGRWWRFRTSGLDSPEGGVCELRARAPGAQGWPSSVDRSVKNLQPSACQSGAAGSLVPRPWVGGRAGSRLSG